MRRFYNRRRNKRRPLEELLVEFKGESDDLKKNYSYLLERMGSLNFATVYRMMECDIPEGTIDLDLNEERHFIEDWWKNAVSYYIEPCVNGYEISIPDDRNWNAYPDFSVYQCLDQTDNVWHMTLAEVTDLIGVAGENYGCFKDNVNVGVGRMIYLAIMLPFMCVTGKYVPFSEVDGLLSRKLVEFEPHAFKTLEEAEEYYGDDTEDYEDYENYEYFEDDGFFDEEGVYHGPNEFSNEENNADGDNDDNNENDDGDNNPGGNKPDNN